MFDGQERPNAARFVFLDPRARDFYLDWDRVARDIVAALRAAAGRNLNDRDLTDLVGELSTRSEEFRQHSARHDVRFHTSAASSASITPRSATSSSTTSAWRSSSTPA